MNGAMKAAMEHMMKAYSILDAHEKGDISEEQMMGESGPELDDMEDKQMGENGEDEKAEALAGEETPEEEKKEEELKSSGLAPNKGTEIDEDKKKESFFEMLKARGTSPMKKAVMGYKK